MLDSNQRPTTARRPIGYHPEMSDERRRPPRKPDPAPAPRPGGTGARPRALSPEILAERAVSRERATVSGHRVTLTLTLFLPALLWATLGGCAPATPPATWRPGNAQPLINGWQRYFEILWAVTRQDRAALIEGHITNTWGFAVREVRVLVNGYDSSGTQTGQLIAWGPNEVQPGERVYFDVTVPAVAATYDVSIFSWRWTWPPSGGPGRRDGEPWTTKHAGDDRSPQSSLTPTIPKSWTARRLVN